MHPALRVGAVLYDPRVSVIWEIISDFFETTGCPIQVKLYSNYELQVQALVDGGIDIAWHSPLAWLDSQRKTGDTCRAIAMRDTDRDRVSHIIVRSDSNIRRIEDLRGKTVATGAQDSPQATLIPLGLLAKSGQIAGRDFVARRFDILVGKHGDHVGGEQEAFQALAGGEADASCLLDLNWATWTKDGSIDPTRYRILVTTQPFDHCVFAVAGGFPQASEKRWLDSLFSMSYDNPTHREMMDLEGLKEWLPGRTTGFGPLAHAVESLGYFEDSKR